jgi:hypothetical protein
VVESLQVKGKMGARESEGSGQARAGHTQDRDAVPRSRHSGQAEVGNGTGPASNLSISSLVVKCTCERSPRAVTTSSLPSALRRGTHSHARRHRAAAKAVSWLFTVTYKHTWLGSKVSQGVTQSHHRPQIALQGCRVQAGASASPGGHPQI